MAGKENSSTYSSVLAPPSAGRMTRSRSALSASGANRSAVAPQTKNIAKIDEENKSQHPLDANWLSCSEVSIADELDEVASTPFSLGAALDVPQFASDASCLSEIMQDKPPQMTETKRTSVIKPPSASLRDLFSQVAPSNNSTVQQAPPQRLQPPSHRQSLNPTMEHPRASVAAIAQPPIKPVSKAPSKTSAATLPPAPVIPQAKTTVPPSVLAVPRLHAMTTRRKAEEVGGAAVVEAKRSKKEEEEKLLREERVAREREAREREERLKREREKERKEKEEAERREVEREVQRKRERERASVSVSSTPVRRESRRLSVASTPRRSGAEPVFNPSESNSLFLEKLQRALESGDSGIGADRRVSRGPVVRSPVKTTGRTLSQLQQQQQQQPQEKKVEDEEDEEVLLV